MKKKGLIIATIVMVLVLAVSLTTATYAWFSATASATIEAVTLTAQAADGLLIGAKASTTDSAYTGYNYGDVTWNSASGIWSGASYMGTNLKFYTGVDEEMAIGTSKAVSYTTAAISGTGASEDVTIAANSWFMANGTTKDEYDKKTAELAVAQVNYVDFDLAVTASKADSVKQAYMTIVVTPSDAAKLKMAAAIHFFIQVGETVYTDTIANHGVSAYDGKSQTNNFSGDVTKGTYASTTGKTVDQNHDLAVGDWAFVVPLYNSATAMTPYEDLVKIKLMMWIEGTDDACIIANAGTGGTINVYFDYSENQTYTFGMTTGASPTQTSGANYNGLMAAI